MASDLDPALVEDVAKARYEQDPVYDIDDGYLVPWEDLGDFDQTMFRIDANGWIRAVDAYRAEAVRAAVYAFAYAAERLQGDVTGDPDELRAAYDDTFDALLALVGAEETE